MILLVVFAIFCNANSKLPIGNANAAPAASSCCLLAGGCLFILCHDVLMANDNHSDEIYRFRRCICWRGKYVQIQENGGDDVYVSNHPHFVSILCHPTSNPPITQANKTEAKKANSAVTYLQFHGMWLLG